ncbi:MAG: GNAT family N-acetyltransferase [Hyphomicrobiales bacterium]|nr:GNAT family N-acetyltransferase [Hyphomicrobiales bacterium]
MPVATIITERLTLRPIAENDAAGLHAAYGDPLAMRFWDYPATDGLEATAGHIRRWLGHDPHWHGVWAIVTRTGAFAGMINYHHREDWNRRLELGWILAPAFWRRGVMTEAARGVVDHCFAALDVHRIEATIDPDNVASRRLAERLGFREEGLMRDRACVEGEFRSLLMYGLVKGA